MRTPWALVLGFPQQAVTYSLVYVIFDEKVLAGVQGWLQMPALFAFLMFFPSNPLLVGAAPCLLLSGFEEVEMLLTPSLWFSLGISTGNAGQ